MEEKRHEEIVEMNKDRDGVYRPVAVIRRPIHIPRKMPAFYEFLSGIEAGLDVFERFLLTMEKLRRKKGW